MRTLAEPRSQYSRECRTQCWHWLFTRARRVQDFWTRTRFIEYFRTRDPDPDPARSGSTRRALLLTPPFIQRLMYCSFLSFHEFLPTKSLKFYFHSPELNLSHSSIYLNAIWLIKFLFSSTLRISSIPSGPKQLPIIYLWIETKIKEIMLTI